MKKKITPKDNTNKRPPQKSGVFSRDFMADEQMWLREESTRSLAAQWEDDTWNDETVEDPFYFLMSKGLRLRTIRTLLEKFDFFQDAYDNVKHMIGMRELKKLKEDGTRREFMLTHLLSDYKDVYKWKSDLKAKTNPFMLQETIMPIKAPLAEKK